MLVASPAGPPRLALHYVHGDDIGYGRVGAGLAEALRRRGIEVDDTTPPDAAGPDRAPPSHAVWLSSPFHATGAWSGQRSTLISMWETDELPASFVGPLHRFEHVLVPSAENVSLFGAHHRDVRPITFGVDAGRWSYTSRPPTDDGFRFLVAGSGRRKGIDLAVDAFHRAFPDPTPRPGVRLVVKGARNEQYASESVDVVAGTLTAAEERALYDSVHCYVQPSRGEGFGLQPLQALAMGIPTILTDAHGHRAYSQFGIPLAARRARADLFAFGECGSWWDVDPAHLASAMRATFGHYDRAVDDAGAASRRIAVELGWDRAASELLDVLGGSERLAAPLAGGATWQPFDDVTYRVVTRRDVAVRMVGGDLEFVGGHETFASPQVKRLLFESGALDDSCLDVPLQRLTAPELAALRPQQRAEYLDWVVEARRVPPRLARRQQAS